MPIACENTLVQSVAPVYREVSPRVPTAIADPLDVEPKNNSFPAGCEVSDPRDSEAGKRVVFSDTAENEANNGRNRAGDVFKFPSSARKVAPANGETPKGGKRTSSAAGMPLSRMLILTSRIMLFFLLLVFNVIYWSIALKESWG